MLNLKVNSSPEKSICPANLEEDAVSAFQMLPREPTLGFDQRVSLLQTHLEPMVNRELIHHRLGKDQGGLSTTLVGWVESN